MAKDIKRMSVEEFRKLGYLQELNRRFLHPLGLALEVVVSDDRQEAFGGVWDFREDPEGIVYNFKDSPPPRIEQAVRKQQYIDEQYEKFRPVREELFGGIIEPILGAKWNALDEDISAEGLHKYPELPKKEEDTVLKFEPGTTYLVLSSKDEISISLYLPKGLKENDDVPNGEYIMAALRACELIYMAAGGHTVGLSKVLEVYKEVLEKEAPAAYKHLVDSGVDVDDLIVRLLTKVNVDDTDPKVSKVDFSDESG